MPKPEVSKHKGKFWKPHSQKFAFRKMFESSREKPMISLASSAQRVRQGVDCGAASMLWEKSKSDYEDITQRRTQQAQSLVRLILALFQPR